MGDLVLYLGGKSLRFTHEDFEKRGVLNTYGELVITLNSEGNKQVSVSHCKNVEEQEERFGGHNAYTKDVSCSFQLFASTKENRSTENTVVFPDGTQMLVVHEVGTGSIEGSYGTTPERIGPSRPAESSRPRSRWDFLRRK